MKVREIYHKENFLYYINDGWHSYDPSFDDKAVSMIDHHNGKIWISEAFWR